MIQHGPVLAAERSRARDKGMDSVAVEADVELGGSDQLWNLMIGRMLQERAGQEPQIPFTMPLLISFPNMSSGASSMAT